MDSSWVGKEASAGIGSVDVQPHEGKGKGSALLLRLRLDLQAGDIIQGFRRLVRAAVGAGDDGKALFHQASGKIASLTDAAGHTTTYSFAAREQTFSNPANGEQVTFTFHNLATVTYPDGAEQQFQRDARGNVTAVLDRTGQTWSYAYNNRLQATNGLQEYDRNVLLMRLRIAL